MKKIKLIALSLLVIMVMACFTACFTVEIDDDFKDISFGTATADGYNETLLKLTNKTVFNDGDIIDYEFRRKVENEEGEFFITASATRVANEMVGTIEYKQANGCIGCTDKVALGSFYYNFTSGELYTDIVLDWEREDHIKEKKVATSEELANMSTLMIDKTKKLNETFSSYELDKVALNTVNYSDTAIKLTGSNFTYESGIQNCENYLLVDSVGKLLSLKTTAFIIGEDGSETELAVSLKKVSGKTIEVPSDLTSYTAVTTFTDYFALANA